MSNDGASKRDQPSNVVSTAHRLSVEQVQVGEGNTSAPLLFVAEFSVSSGAIVAVSGPSGSGKSSLLRVLTGRQKALSGRVLVDGQELASLSESRLDRLRAKKFAQVAQGAGLVQGLSAFDNVQVGVCLAGRKAEPRAVEEALADLGLSGLGRSFPGELSGGQRQRVQIVRALLSAAPFLVMDEPTSGLDSGARAAVLNRLDEAVRQGRCALLVSHDPAVLEHCHAHYEITDQKRLERRR